MKTEIKKLNYENIKKYFTYYNAKIAAKFDSMGSDDILDGFSGGINLLQKQFLTFLTGAKERFIDMVFEFKAQNVLEKNPKEQDLINCESGNDLFNYKFKFRENNNK